MVCTALCCNKGQQSMPCIVYIDNGSHAGFFFSSECLYSVCMLCGSIEHVYENTNALWSTNMPSCIFIYNTMCIRGVYLRPQSELCTILRDDKHLVSRIYCKNSEGKWLPTEFHRVVTLVSTVLSHSRHS